MFIFFHLEILQHFFFFFFRKRRGRGSWSETTALPRKVWEEPRNRLRERSYLGAYNTINVIWFFVLWSVSQKRYDFQAFLFRRSPSILFQTPRATERASERARQNETRRRAWETREKRKTRRTRGKRAWSSRLRLAALLLPCLEVKTVWTLAWLGSRNGVKATVGTGGLLKDSNDF